MSENSAVAAFTSCAQLSATMTRGSAVRIVAAAWLWEGRGEADGTRAQADDWSQMGRERESSGFCPRHTRRISPRVSSF
jgi:hypothetical protein